MSTSARLEELTRHAGLFTPWTGPVTREALEELLTAEFGAPSALDDDRSLHVPETLVHVVSGNTPHAAFQSLLRGLVLGCHNRIKIPSAGLPEFEAAVESLPPALGALVELSRDLPDEWLSGAEVLILYGSDETIELLSARASAGTRIIAHGHRLSIGIVRDDPQTAARLAAVDICRFDQRGCLSVHDVYVHPDCPVSPPAFAALLAGAMDRDVRKHPPSPLTPSEAGAITTLRETVRFLSASCPDDYQLWESNDSTDWTVLYEADPTLKVSCLNRTAYVKPWPADPGTLGPVTAHLACVALHPFPGDIDLGPLAPSRICALGDTQHPPLTWHQDGYAPLASLTTR